MQLFSQLHSKWLSVVSLLNVESRSAIPYPILPNIPPSQWFIVDQVDLGALKWRETVQPYTRIGKQRIHTGRRNRLVADGIDPYHHPKEFATLTAATGVTSRPFF